MGRKLNFSKTRLSTKSKFGTEVAKFPELREFDNILNEESWVHGENHYKIVDKENTSDYFWLYVEYNKPNPRREKIYNTATKEERPNERTHVEVELLKQNFFLYHHESNILYIKNLDDKNMLIEMLKKHNREIEYFIESFYSFEEFINKLKTVKKIGFTDAEGLFGSLRQHLNIDVDAHPDAFQLILQYDKSSVEKLADFIKSLFTKYHSYEIKNLFIKGYDENNFETIFNKDTFTQKIGINPKKNHEDLWDFQDVKTCLLEEILHA